MQSTPAGFLSTLGLTRPATKGSIPSPSPTGEPRAGEVLAPTPEQTASVHCDAPRSPPAPGSIPAAEVPTRRALEPADLAAELLVWLQGEGGRTGAMTHIELERALSDMCLAQDIEPLPWHRVARAFRPLIRDRKRYIVRDGVRYRLYHVPPRMVVSCTAAQFRVGAAA